MKNRMLFAAAILIFVVYMLNIAISYNYEYVNVTSKVNITNAYPEILNITIDQNILLSAGTTKIVQCNVSIRDWNGYNDIALVNATLFHSTSTHGAADDNNTHYTNTNCTPAVWNDLNYTANFTCNFTVWYFANPGSWNCNVTVIDNYNFTDTQNLSTTVQTYYALNVTPTIDFGNMAVGETKNNITANVTNFGNANINVSVDGYGSVDGDGLAMVCQIRNLTLDDLRYSMNASLTWNGKTPLTDTPTNISGLMVPKRTAGELWNTTYWDLYIQPSENPFGQCNGTVVFTAWATS